MLGILRALWQYRYFVLSSIRNELWNRFAQSKLGGLWVIIHPMAQVAIYALILSNILAAKLPGTDSKYAYTIYLMAGLLGWNLFNEITTRCVGIFVEQSNLMKKISFPKITLPAIVVGSCVLNYIMLFVAIMGTLVLLSHHFSSNLIWLIPLTFVTIAFAMGVGLILGVLNVFLRDIGQVVPIVLQMWFWFTPVVYPSTVIPEEYRYLLNFNPMYAITDAYQQILVYGNAPQIEILLPVTLVSCMLLLASLFLFRRASTEMVDVL